MNENVWISIKISLKFAPMGPINNILALVQIMACCQRGNKPLSEPVMVNLIDAYMCRSASFFKKHVCIEIGPGCYIYILIAAIDKNEYNVCHFSSSQFPSNTNMRQEFHHFQNVFNDN